MKRRISLMLSLLLATVILASSTSAFAQAEHVEDTEALSVTPLAPDGFSDDPLMQLMHGDGSDDDISVYSSIIVKVTSPCDQKWRAKYPSSWMYEANRAIEDADEFYRNYYLIDLRSVSQREWTSNVADGKGSSFLNNAWNQFGLNGADIMIAFSGEMPGVGGVASLNQQRCIVFDQGYSANACATRHEVGHLYGCPDDYNITNFPYACFMNDAYGQYNSICRGCDPRIAVNRYRFGS